MPTTTHTFPTPEPISLHVRSDRGVVEVVAADVTETTVTITCRQDPPPVSVEHAAAAGRLTIEPIGRFRPQQPRMIITVRLPRRSRLELSTASAGIEVRGTVGDTTVDTASGSVTLDHVDGRAEVRSASGAVRVRQAGELELRSASGGLSAGHVDGVLAAQTASGSISVASAGADVAVRSTSGSVKVGEVRGGTVELQSTSGSVGVGVRRGTLVWLDVSSVSGRVTSGLEGGAVEPPTDEPPLRLHAHTVSGSISIASVGSTEPGAGA